MWKAFKIEASGLQDQCQALQRKKIPPSGNLFQLFREKLRDTLGLKGSTDNINIRDLILRYFYRLFFYVYCIHLMMLARSESWANFFMAGFGLHFIPSLFILIVDVYFVL